MAENRIARMRSGVTVPENQREILPDLEVKKGDKVLVQLADGTVGMANIGEEGGLAPTGSTSLPEDAVLDGGSFV